MYGGWRQPPILRKGMVVGDWINITVNIATAFGAVIAVWLTAKKTANMAIKESQQLAIAEERRFTQIEDRLGTVEKNQNQFEQNIYADLREYRNDTKEDIAKLSKDICKIQDNIQTILSKLIN